MRKSSVSERPSIRGLQGDGLARAVRAALAEAGIGPEDVDHINAHGLATRESDAWEARDLHEVFGNCSPPVPVFAPKSYIGNLGAGGSTTELAASVLAMSNGSRAADAQLRSTGPGLSDYRPDRRTEAVDPALRGQGELHADGPVRRGGRAAMATNETVSSSGGSLRTRSSGE